MTTRRTFLTAAGTAGLLGLGAVQTSGQSETSSVSRESFTLMSGTDKATKVYVTKADQSGPTALIVGGMHGNEEAGYKAAAKIAEWDIARGTLVTIPKANAEAVAQDSRTSDGDGDLNRQFPTGEAPETELARAIWGVVEEYQPDVVADLHESVGIYDGDMVGGVGQAIFYNWEEAASAEAKETANYLNENYVSRDGYEFSTDAFSPSSNEPNGLFTHKAARDAGARAYLAEVTSKDTSLDKRVQWHTNLARQLVEEELFATSGDGGDGGGGDDGGEGNDGGDGGEGNDGGGGGGNDDTGSGDEKNEPPVARIRTSPSNVSDGSLERGQTVTLDASKSEDGDSEIVEYMWDLDGDGSFETAGKKTKLTVNKCGTYQVVLQVTDDKGAKTTDEVTITTVK
ncbi:PKD domain-containing protein [Haladaptatus salinisoli]|uniref:PKD domain-containing protein n=1 Tax=Haladaptatus salinisoli TaxID=2884876 RepID=UPI001D0A0440|nr:PKD domain-containing protein [Haladaptatus salinisoli]